MRAGIIFDLDGVLTDTVEFHYRSWKRLAGELGITFSRGANEALRGRSRGEALELFLAGRSKESDPRELRERKNGYFLEYVAELGPQHLLAGVEGLLHSARAAGLGLGLASSSQNARLVCSKLGVLDLFDAFADGCSGLRPKPEPDTFLWVAGRLDLRPQECVVVEDATAGVAAALAGGFRVVGLGPRERVGKAHLVLNDLGQATLDDLLPSSSRGETSANARVELGNGT